MQLLLLGRTSDVFRCRTWLTSLFDALCAKSRTGAKAGARGVFFLEDAEITSCFSLAACKSGDGSGTATG